jgi:ATP-binding cassette subfamily B protein
MHHGGIYAEEITGRAYDTRLLLRFVRSLAPYRAALLTVLATLPLLAGSRLLQPWIIKLAIDNHISTGDLAGLTPIAFVFAGILLAESLVSFLQVYLLQSVGQRVMADMRDELYRQMLALKTTWFDQVPTGSVVTRLTSDVEVLGEMFAAGIITIVGDVLLLLGIVSVMLWMNLKLSLVTFTVLPLLLYVAWAFRRRMRQSFREVRARLGRLNGYLAECITGISIIQAFNQERNEERRFSELNASYRDANMPVIFWDASLYAIVEALSSVAIALIIWYGGGEIVRGTLTFGVLVAFIQYIEKFFTPIRDLSAKYSVMQGAMAALERIYALLDTPATEDENCTGIFPQPAAGEDVPLIEFRDVTFAYRPGEHALYQFNLTVRAGERIALVGESGSGKTTLTRLLVRLYEIDSGAILLNGRDIRQIPLVELRRHICIVVQDPCLFTGSIAFNICLGNEEARSRIAAAAAAVGADRFIERLPDKYDEKLLERGNNLSTGEKQLISFARAVAFDPEILVLDEATASIDAISEQMIQEGINGLMRGRTSLVVAHRLSTIRDADRIVLLHRGKKLEEGSHQELMQAKGRYYRLQRLQFGDLQSP